MTETSKEDNVTLQRIPYVHYLIQFKKKEVQALVDSGSEVNAITPAYAANLDLKIQKTNIGAQKINGSILNTFEMVLIDFQIEDKLGWPWFFQETFLIANTTLEVILGMPFLTLSNADI